MFVQGDIDEGHFGVDEQGLTIIMGFSSISFLPQSFTSYSLFQSNRFSLLLDRFSWPDASKMNTMIKIAVNLGMTAPSRLGVSISCGRLCIKISINIWYI